MPKPTIPFEDPSTLRRRVMRENMRKMNGTIMMKGSNCLKENSVTGSVSGFTTFSKNVRTFVVIDFKHSAP
jgi:hypothetical protein